MTQAESMDGFFTARAESYDEHMLYEVEGCREGYERVASLLPEGAQTLLDLGCGTGLELDPIFKRNPSIDVTGIDITKAMLTRLEKKYPGRRLRLINADYFKYDFGIAAFDAAISCQTLHHFTHGQKSGLYARICAALKPFGVYIECDYMVEEQSEEDRFFEEARHMRGELGIGDGELLHIDTPCTIQNQLALIKSAGFSSAETVWRKGATAIIVARKQHIEKCIQIP
ncbi:MAG: class I SAM-dependent methyltransferase [Burkholderiales bacterium]